MITTEQFRANLKAIKEQGGTPEDLQMYADKVAKIWQSGTENNVPPAYKQMGITKMPATDNYASKALSFLKDLGEGAGKATLNTVQALGSAGNAILKNTAGRAVEAITGAPKEQLVDPIYEKGSPEYQAFKDENKYEGTTQKIAGGVTNVAQSMLMTPVAKSIQAVKSGAGVLNGTKNIILDALANTGINKISTDMSLEDSAKFGALGASIPAIGKTIQTIGSKVIDIPRKLIAGASGLGDDVLKSIVDTPKFGKEATEYAKKIINTGEINSVLDDVSKAVDDFRIRRNYAYKTALENLTDEVGRPMKVLVSPKKAIVYFDATGNLEGDTLEQAKTITHDGVMKSIKDLLTSKNISTLDDKLVVGKKSGNLTNDEIKILNNVLDDVNLNHDVSPVGLNQNAVMLNQYRRGDGSKTDAIIDTIKSKLRGYASEVVPAIKTMNDKYKLDSEQLDNFRFIFKDIDSGIQAKDSKATLQALRSLFSDANRSNMDFIDEFVKDSGVNVKGIAGAIKATDSDVPLGTGLIEKVVRSVFDHNAVAKGALKYGEIKEVAKNLGIGSVKLKTVLDSMSKFTPEEKQAFFNAITKSYGQNNE